MKILVCISCVPDTTSKINFKNNDTEFDDSQIQYIINPNDEFGLTRAIWSKENVWTVEEDFTTVKKILAGWEPGETEQ